MRRDEGEWPTHCPACGTELQSEVVEALVTNDWNRGTPMTILAQDVCPNPACPGTATDVAIPTGPDGARA